MRQTRNIVLGFAFLLPFIPSPVQAKDTCNLPQLMHQQKDEATIQNLEEAWNVAYLHGDTNFERCLLATDFTSISRKGQVRVLADELAVAAENKGKNLPIPSFAKTTVLIHGNVAVAYATVNSTGPDGKPRMTVNADYYVWENGSWHAFFAQQTQVQEQ